MLNSIRGSTSNTALPSPGDTYTEHNAIQLTTLQLKNFRCFSHTHLTFEKSRVLIQGANGSGKTSLLEALHYLCYVRSFRTHIPQELAYANAPSFFIKAAFINTTAAMPIAHEAQIGFQNKRRLVKIDDRPINSYKELLAHYRVLTLTEEDILLVSGSPEVRRTFLDQALILRDPQFITLIKNMRACLGQRNALLQDPRHSYDSYLLWTQQLWELSTKIQEQRYQLLAQLENEIATLSREHGGDRISCHTHAKLMRPGETFQAFLEANADLHTKEKFWGRTLFGAHLDDFSIDFQEKRSKTFASRGQQKLIALLFKIALIKLLNRQEGPKPLFLLDDFITDFDDNRVIQLVSLLDTLENQLIFTCPLRSSTLSTELTQQGAQRIELA